MRFSIIWLIFRREVHDQLRDRRTLMMIVGLPIVLYPLLGLGIAQFAASFENKPRLVFVLNSSSLPEEPRLLESTGEQFATSLFDSPNEASRLRIRLIEPENASKLESDTELRRDLVRLKVADAIVRIPYDIQDQIARDVRAGIEIDYDSSDERSELTYRRVTDVLSRWSEQIVKARLERDNKPPSYVKPIRAVSKDVASVTETGGGVWAKLFPFLLVMMSLTGAFYPAIDLCAGEKERGTMETLLISPATRTEIVLGKFLTIMLASVMTTLINLASMGLTSLQLSSLLTANRAAGAGAGMTLIAPPSWSSAGWMIVLLIPLSAFFSALCLSLAVLARSMKEGQYYMAPVYFIALPLIFVTLAPEVELNLLYSLVPVTGVSLLLRTLMQGDYLMARKYFLPVLIPTLLYAWIALRWAIFQFQRESVLYREAERVDLKAWLIHLRRDRSAKPTTAQALFCFVVMLVATWFLGMLLPPTLAGMATSQVVLIAAPALAMAWYLTSTPASTLRLTRLRLVEVIAAAALALALHPVLQELRVVVEGLFPLSDAVKQSLSGLLRPGISPVLAVLVLALLPAICEELAFRGFILSGLDNELKRGTAIIASALLFGLLHALVSLYQQMFNATLLGVLLGWLALRTGSLFPCIVFHFLNNGLVVGLQTSGAAKQAAVLYRDPANLLYQPVVVGSGVMVAIVILAFFALRPTPGAQAESTKLPSETSGFDPAWLPSSSSHPRR